MNVSPYYKFAFVEIPKTGTTSIEEALQGALQGSRLSSYYHRVYRKVPHLFDILAKPKLLEVGKKHLTLADFQGSWVRHPERFRTFTIVRNPWERLVSQFKQLQKPYNLHMPRRRKLYEASKISFEAFTDEYMKDDVPMWRYLTDSDGNIAVNLVGRFENIANDFRTICLELGLPKLEISWLNKSNQDKASYQEYYTEELIDKLEPIMRKDMKLFRYSFNNPDSDFKSVITGKELL